MQTPLRKKCHSKRNNIHPHSAHPILVDHPTRGVPGDTNHSIVRALMEVWWQHTARSKFQQCIADAHACDCWKCGGVGGDDGANGVVEVFVVEEVVVPVAVFGEKRVSVVICGGHFEHRVEVWVE